MSTEFCFEKAPENDGLKFLGMEVVWLFQTIYKSKVFSLSLEWKSWASF